MTTTVRKFAVGVATAALVAGVAAPAMAAQEPLPLNGGWARYASDRVNNDRVDTAIAVAKKAFPVASKAKAVYVANSRAMIDSATAGQLTDGPVLLVDNNPRTLDVVAAQIAEYTSADTVYAIGGETVVPDSVLKSVAGNKKTSRLGGETRYDTAMAVAKRVIEVAPKMAKTILVARGDNPVDALAAGTIDEGPIFYIKDGKLPEDVVKWVEEKHVTKIVGLGGTNVLPDSALSEATASIIKVNPSEVDEAAIKAYEAFKAARALYLGVNEFTSDEFTPRAPLATSRDPKALNDQLAGPSERFEGYKALAEEVNARKADVDAAVSYWKTQIFNAFVADKKTVANHKTSGGILANGGTVVGYLEELYGSTLTTAILADAKSFKTDADENVTDVDYAYVNAKVEAVKDALASDAARVKKYFLTADGDWLSADPGTLTDAATAGVTAGAYESQKLFPDWNGTPGEIRTGLTTTSQGHLLAILQADVNAYAKVANDNAASTKASMEAAYAKISTSKNFYRLGGETRYETSAMISRYLRTQRNRDFTGVFLANGQTMVDALVAGTLTEGPIILTNSAGTLTDTVKKELNAIGRYRLVNTVNGAPTYRTLGDYPTVYAIGGTVAIADSTAAAAAAEIKAGNDGVPTSSGVSLSKSTLTADLTTAQGDRTVNVYVGGKSTNATPGVEFVSTSVSGATASNRPTATPLANGKVEFALPAAATDIKDGTYTYKVTVPGEGSAYINVVVKLATQPITVSLAATVDGGAADHPVNLKNTTSAVPTGALTIVKTADNSAWTADSGTVSPASFTYTALSGVTVNVAWNNTDKKIELTPASAQNANATGSSQDVVLTLKKAGYKDFTQTIKVYYDAH